MPIFSIIIPVLNRPEYTRACLDSVLGSGHEVIVVDNGSRGGTRRLLASYGPRLRVVRMEENGGTAAAYNAGGQASSGDYLVFLHNDCVAPAGWDEYWPDYARQMESGPIKIATPVTNYSDEATFVHSPEMMADFVKIKPSNKDKISDDEVAGLVRRAYEARGGLDVLARGVASPWLEPVDETSSFCMIVARATLDEVGWLDRSFRFRGHEEKELLFRMGLRGFCPGRAGFFVHHFGNITSDGPGFNCREMKDANKPVFDSLTRAYAAQARSEFDYSCVLYPDADPALTRRALASINQVTRKPRMVVEVPPPGMFPERKAMAWALPQIDSEFTAVVDGDMVLDPSSIGVMANYFSDPGVGCVAAMMRDPISGVVGYFKVWRTEVLRRITFGDGEIKDNLPDTGYALGCERLGYKLLRVPDVVGEHGVSLDPWNIFRIYFRMGVKQRARRRVGTPAQTWGIEGLLKERTRWAHIGLVAFHCGIQVDHQGDVHGPSWDEFAWGHYQPVRMFCEALAADTARAALAADRERRRVVLANRGMAMGGIERSMRLLAASLDRSRFEPIIMFDGEKDDVMLSMAESACRVVHVGSEGEWTTALVEHSPDVVVSFLRTPVVEAARRMRIPIIERTPGWNGHSGMRKDAFRRVVCEYEGFREEILAMPDLGAIPEKTVVIRSLVDRLVATPRDEARASMGIRADAVVMVCVARIDPVKDLSVQVRALAMLRDAELHVVGGCVGRRGMEEKASLERLAEDLGVSGRIFFHGVTRSPDLYMCAADVVTLSSSAEGVPNCLLEAMSLGLPIAATRVGGVEEATMGLACLAPPGDPEAFAVAVREALSRHRPVEYPMERHDSAARALEWGDLLDEVCIERYGGGDRIRVALLCDELCIGGMEMFVALMDDLVDKRRFDLYVYAVSTGPLAERLSCVVRVAGGPRELADRKVSRWIRDDKIDVAIVISYRNADRAFAAGNLCRVIERLDGAMSLCPPAFPDVVVFQSDLLASEMATSYAGKESRIIRNGRRLDVPLMARAEARSMLGVTEEIVVACVNRIARSKNNGMLVDVALALRRMGARARIFVMGPDCGDRPDLEARVADAGVGDMLSIIEGSLDGPRGLLAAADVYAHTSTFEGLSGAVIEACAAGLPVVAVDAGAMRELVTPSNGMLVRAGEAEAMASFIASMNDGRGLAMGEESRRVSRRFCARRMVREWEALIMEQAPMREVPRALTIVMAAHGDCVHAGAAIDSVLAQTCGDWRLVVAADGPPSQGLRSIIRERADPRISLVEFPRGNHCRTLNAAVVGVGTDFWMRLDSDDMLSQAAVADVLAAIAANPGIDYFYLGDETIDEDGRHVSFSPAEAFSPERLEEWHIARMPAVRTDKFLECGGYPEDIPYGEDYFLALSMMLSGCRFMALAGCLYKYRQHDAGRLSARNLKMERESFIEMVRGRYLALKRFSGVTLYGEEPGAMRPRRRVARRTM